MSQWREWDWPQEPKRRPRVEVLPPERDFVRVTIRSRRRRQVNLAPLLITALVLFAIWRLKLWGALLMAAALLGLLPH
jgi:hypothetical protein